MAGPSYKDIADRYRQDPDAVRVLYEKVKQGGAGVWGPSPMPSYRAVRDEHVARLVEWILSH